MLASPLPQAAHRSAAAAGDEALHQALRTCQRQLRLVLPRVREAHNTGSNHVEGRYHLHAEDFFAIGNWTTSFFTGMALLELQQGPDPALLAELQAWAPRYRDKVTVHAMETMHDLGFLYSLYSVGLFRLTGEAQHRSTALLAADVLAGRFVPRGRYIRAWGRMDEPDTDYAGLAIIDCMMNLPLLFWASEATGQSSYRDIALQHADTTLASFVRPDHSVSHAFRFDAATGAPVGPANYCGYGVHTTWARGQAWALYGFAMAYRHGGQARHLDAACRIAHRFLDRLGADSVPVWDFDLSPDQPALLDTSAAAIAVCGLMELHGHRPDARLDEAAQRLLAALCADHVEPADGLGVLRDGEVGDGLLPGGEFYRARNVYTSWGDYFLMEALMRRLHGTPCPW